MSLLMTSTPGQCLALTFSMHINFQIPETWLQALLPFPAPPPEHPGDYTPNNHPIKIYTIEQIND